MSIPTPATSAPIDLRTQMIRDLENFLGIMIKRPLARRPVPMRNLPRTKLPSQSPRRGASC